MTPVYGNTAVAPALRFETVEAPPVREEAPAAEAAKPAVQRRTPAYQPSLFNSRELPRVVPFESIAPEAVPPRQSNGNGMPRLRPRKVIPGQQSLDFTLAGPAEGVIYCDSPVAVPAHRALAAALDTSVVLIALGIFGSIFSLAGGQLVLNAKTLPLIAAIAATFVVFYKLLWCLANGDTAGMRWTRLKLVNFDGKAPDRRHRMYRLASGVLSLLAAGLGMLWALVDEETLTWHDHISKTFPTPY